jgi:5-methylcytosine-specific restriction endonuclease McrA
MNRYTNLRSYTPLKKSPLRRKPKPLHEDGRAGFASNDSGFRTPVVQPRSKSAGLSPKGKRGKRLEKRDDEVRPLVRERAKGRCEVCGGPGNQVMHAIKRDDEDYRWDLSNLFYGCDACHGDQDTPGGQGRFWAVIRDRFPERFAVIGHRARFGAE